MLLGLPGPVSEEEEEVLTHSLTVLIEQHRKSFLCSVETGD